MEATAPWKTASPPAHSLLRPPAGSPLWSAALSLWLTNSPTQADEPHWAFDVAHAYIASEYAWPKPDYHLRIARQAPDRVVVYAHHRDDNDMATLNSQGFIRAGGGKSFEMFLSTKTHSVISEWHFQ